VLDHGRVVQLAPPEQVYQQPATLFVARFTGSAGELPGKVLAIDGGCAVIDVAGYCLRARYSGPLSAGLRVRVLVRPAATRVLADSMIADVALPGTVIDVAYRGRGYEHVVTCPGGILAAIFDARRWPRGSQLMVGLDPGGCVAYAESAAEAVAMGTVE
jgi:ABC-type Fe3+/spermidine/putrescine transport system ATPase subunit